MWKIMCAVNGLFDQTASGERRVGLKALSPMAKRGDLTTGVAATSR